MSITAADAMNDALEMCVDLGYEMAPGFSTHWPMGSEALIALGHPEQLHGWVERYRIKVKHYPRPEPVASIDRDDESDWRATLGRWDRVGDWQQLFERELAEDHWRTVLVRWWPRLVPGVGAGLTHGLIRTMHAVRGIDRAGDPASALYLRELATALAYWAAKYVEQPGRLMLTGSEDLPGIIAEIPRLDPQAKIALKEKGSFQQMHDVPGWADAVAQLQQPTDIPAAISDITASLAQVQLAHPNIFPIPLVHTITAPAAMRVMLGYLPDELHPMSFVAIWKIAAALMSSFALEPNAAETARDAPEDAQPTISLTELAGRAVEHGDQHALKLADAVIREYSARPDPRYLVLSERLLARLPRFYRGARQDATPV